jgi:hypothetical protein
MLSGKQLECSRASSWGINLFTEAGGVWPPARRGITGLYLLIVIAGDAGAPRGRCQGGRSERPKRTLFLEDDSMF